MNVATWTQRTRADKLIMPADFGSRLGISSRFASILWNRGLSHEEQVDRFLAPHLRYLEQPNKWPDIQKAALLIVDNLLQGKKLAVWGDYDVDGVTSVSIVLEVLRHYHFTPLWHLPERFNEGYGLNEHYIEQLAQQGAGILLTVDCGISDIKEVDTALKHNMVVIISDHHVSPDTLPNAHALCNPKLSDCPCDSLAGVGVAFFLMAEVNKILSENLKIPKFDMRNCLDLVALGSLADMVPLEGQNRILVKNGLLKIQQSERVGLAALKSVCNLNVHDSLTSRQIVFNLAPRINAAGRIANAKVGVELFTSHQKDEAIKFALQLDDYNEQRKSIEKEITEQAIALAENQQHEPVLFVRHETWNQGIVGIVASRLVEKFAKPAFVFCKDGDYWKASARSIPGFDLHSGLVACSKMLHTYGGHKMAAGLRVNDSKYFEFTKAYAEFFESMPHEVKSGRKIVLDGELNFAEAISHDFRKEILSMQPFGIGNEEPTFSSPVLYVTGYSIFGANKNHVKLTLQDMGTGVSLQVKLWSQVHKYPREMLNRQVKVAFSPNFDNNENFQTEYIKVKDWYYAEYAI